MKNPVSCAAVLAIFLLLCCRIWGQGVAILKEQVFHRDSTATAVPFTRIIDSQGPLVRIVSGERGMNVIRSKLVDWLEVPTAIPSSISNEKEVAPLRIAAGKLEKFITRYPHSAPLLDSQLVALRANISRFDQGYVRFEKVWIKNEKKAGILKKREKEAAELRLAEIEKTIFAAAQRDKGLVLYMGKWMKPEEIELIPPVSPTPLSECVKPLVNGDIVGAGFALENLERLATDQTGAPKVRTLRLMAVVRNLFRAEAKLVNQNIVASGSNYQASLRRDNADSWLKPNFFGTVNKNAANKAEEDAEEIRKVSALNLASCRKELLDELRGTDSVVEDFHKLREFRVVLTLDTAVRIVAARHFSKEEFKPAFPEETLEMIRRDLRESNGEG